MAITVQKELLGDLYINNKLDEAAKTAFEIAMMEDAEILQHVQMLDAMKTNLANRPELSSQSTSAVVLPFSAWVRQPMSLAASLLVAVLGINTLNDGSIEPSASSASLPISSVILLEGSRGDTGATFSGAPPYLFQVDVGFGNPTGDLSVTLSDSSTSETVIHLTGLQADHDGWVRLVLNEPLAGDYELTLGSTDANGAPQARKFPLSVSPAN